MVMDDPVQAVSLMADLKRIGVHLSLDDFGTGYSSLAYLSRFPIDSLKIDRSFISGIVTDPDSATIATSIIALAHRMRLRVVAEGVETEAQLGYLRQNGCDEMQGFFFSKAVPAGELAALLREGKALPPVEETSDAPTLLIVDDEPSILSALRRLLFEDGYRILTAGSARDGLEILARNAVQVIITDQRMPEMCGTEFLGRVKALHPNTVRMVLSGYADLATVTESVNEGALYKFLSKPWNDDQLREQIREAFVFYETNIKPRGVQ
jgi:CheY-like chemotaxis protein